jgi:MarR family transcriptional regulator, organic hydroperoxide resistance regulator
MRTDTAREAWSSLVEVTMQHRTHFLEAVAEFDLTPMQFHALKLLAPGRTMAMNELADRLFCDASNVTGIVDRLESRGLVERGSAADRRVKALAVTPAGEKLRARMMERLGQPPPGVAALSAEEQRTLTKLLQRILEGNRQRTDGER